MIFGKWWELIERYPTGLKNNRDMVYNLISYLNKAVNEESFKNQEKKARYLLQLRDDILRWSEV